MADQPALRGEPSVYALVFSEARRALDDQERALSDVHSRTGVLLSAAAIATSFLGGQALTDHHNTGWTWTAFALFVGVAVLTLLVLWPTKSWTFSIDPATTLAEYAETDSPASIERAHRDFALSMGESYDEQEPQIERLTNAFRLATVALALEVLAWLGDIAIGG
jgi:hypothetical protein